MAQPTAPFTGLPLPYVLSGTDSSDDSEGLGSKCGQVLVVPQPIFFF